MQLVLVVGVLALGIGALRSGVVSPTALAFAALIAWFFGILVPPTAHDDIDAVRIAPAATAAAAAAAAAAAPVSPAAAAPAPAPAESTTSSSAWVLVEESDLPPAATAAASPAASPAALPAAPPPAASSPRSPPASLRALPSLPVILRSEEWSALFRSFVTANCDDSNLSFYFAARDFEDCCTQCLEAVDPQQSPQLRAAWSKAATICDRFVEVDAYDTIELDDATRCTILARVRGEKRKSENAAAESGAAVPLPPRSVFDRALSTVVRSLAREVYPAFSKSDEGRALAALIAAPAS